MILSVIINAWDGSDLYRFRLQLETFLYRPRDPSKYLELCKVLLDDWEKGEFEIPEDLFENTFKNLGFERTRPEAPEVEFVLALDGVKSENSKIREEFEKWLVENDLRGSVISGVKLGVAGMRNLGIQKSVGEFVIFRDDDDFSMDIASILAQCRELKKMNFGRNKPYGTPTNEYTHVLERRSQMLSFQKYPTIAIFEDGYRLKNMWGTLENPFSKTPTPVDSTTIELIDRPTSTSMCSKIFSRESLRFIYNSPACNSLEDARSHYLQQLSQHCVWLFEKSRLNWLRSEWAEFKRSNGRRGLDGVKWLNLNVLNYPEWQIKINKRFRRSYRNEEFDFEAEAVENYEDGNSRKNEWRNLDEMFRRYFKEKIFRGPNFCYVLPSNSYGSSSWSYCSVVGALEAFRNSRRSVDFTIGDLVKLKEVIQASISTRLVSTNCVTRVAWVGGSSERGEILARALEGMNNYRYIYWFGVVNRCEDWGVLEKRLERIRELVGELHSSISEKNEDADVINDRPIHPNQLISLDRNYCASGLTCEPIENTEYLNYTDWEEPQMRGGSGMGNMVVPILLLLLLFVVILMVVLLMNRDSSLRNCLRRKSLDDART